ncbi:GNAT family protein [Fulvimarina sp. MAC8]|uniref:GNAT family N-acetyltransferase n=1 Tax=Fulvimarina sp. MAC8 TaxID=3162874 RepID=UPI0032EB35A6
MTLAGAGTGSDLSTYAPRVFPGTETLVGRTVTMEPITDDSRFGELWEAYSADRDGDLWRWMHSGPFQTEEAYRAYASKTYLQDGHRFYAFIPKDIGRAAGACALFRADLSNGVIEIGHVCLAPSIQRTVAAGEGYFLLMRMVFDTLGYRRFEWKCNALNEPSKRAAARLGFSYEGLFRQHQIVKGENRDTAWFSMLDREWPALEPAFERWLDPENFDADGNQRRPLSELTAEALGKA